MSVFYANGFSSDLLDAWEDRSTITLVGPTSADGFASNLVVTRQRLDSGTTIREFAKAQLSALADQVDDLFVDSSGVLAGNHHESFHQVHRFTAGGKLVRQMQAYFAQNTARGYEGFVVTGTAAAEEFAQVMSRFEHFIKHFHIVHYE